MNYDNEKLKANDKECVSAKTPEEAERIISNRKSGNLHSSSTT